MRIALFTETYLPKVDGVVTMLSKTVEYLQARGDELIIFAPRGGPDTLHGVEVVGLPSWSFLLYPEMRLALPRWSIRARLEAFRPDVIHAIEPWFLGAGAIYLSQSMNIPLVTSAHTDIPGYARYYKLRFLEKFVWFLMQERHRRANLNLATSTVTMNDLRAHGVERLALWERAVDSELFHPRAASAEMRCRLSGGEPQKPLLLYVGRLSAEKEVARLRAVVDAYPDVRLAIVGDGPLRAELERLFAGTATVFLGYLKGRELASAYASADVFLFASQTETLGLVLLEAMASGLAVVACNAGGIPDAVQDGVTGYLFEPGDPEGLVKAVRRVLSNPAEADAVRARARADVEAHSWADATEQLRGLYAQTIAEYRPVAARGGPMRAAMAKATVAVCRRMLA
jgi:glycosyltransferase involved in cell wall biosynthesis